jgi:hypothetical protein
MSLPAMNLGATNRRQTILAGVLGVLALGAVIYVYEEVFADSTPAAAPVAATAPARPAGGGASAKPVTSATLDPTLHMDAMLVSESLEYSGTGRNIFSMNSAPAVPISMPKPLGPARPLPPPPPPVPCPPNCPPPPPPPPIDLKFFGVETAANGTRQACLLHGDDVILAFAGDIVLRRYRMISVDARSIQVEDMQNKNTQTLPLLAN